MKESTFKITLATVELQLEDLKVDCRKTGPAFKCKCRQNKS